MFIVSFKCQRVIYQIHFVDIQMNIYMQTRRPFKTCTGQQETAICCLRCIFSIFQDLFGLVFWTAEQLLVYYILSIVN